MKITAHENIVRDSSERVALASSEHTDTQWTLIVRNRHRLTLHFNSPKTGDRAIRLFKKIVPYARRLNLIAAKGHVSEASK